MAETRDQRIVRECEETGEPYIVFRAKDVLSGANPVKIPDLRPDES